MASIHGILSASTIQAPPIVAELEAIFREFPDEELLTKLRGPRRRGPKGYDPIILWRSYIAFYYLALPSVSDLIRCLHDNPWIAAACGIEGPIPSQPTFSRFFGKLATYEMRAYVSKVFHGLTRRLSDTLPDFGKSVAIDATDLKAWSNGAKRPTSDKDAGWVVKGDTHGKKKYVWGYKLTLAVDTESELPMAFKLTKGNVADVKVAAPVLNRIRNHVSPRFHPEYIIADAGYSSQELRTFIQRQYRAMPIIKAHPLHARARKRYPETPEFRMAYSRRQSVERVNARLKGHRRLNSIRVRGLMKVEMHCLLALVTMQAQALATGCRASVRKVA